MSMNRLTQGRDDPGRKQGHESEPTTTRNPSPRVSVVGKGVSRTMVGEELHPGTFGEFFQEGCDVQSFVRVVPGPVGASFVLVPEVVSGTPVGG